MAGKRAVQKPKSNHVFGQARKRPEMFRAGLYARVSTNDQQTLAMQNRAMREYAARRGWTIALQVREVNSGAVPREARSHLSPPNPWSEVMKRPKRDPVREDRIYNEAIVDARPEEQAMSWYYYLEGKITFPFRARCVAANAVSPLRKGEAIEVLRMAVGDACEHDMLVQIRWQGRKMAVPLSQLEVINPDESTQEAIGDWHYWVAQGYCL